MTKRITKVRYKASRVEVHEVEEQGEPGERTTESVTKCAEEPAPSFVDALRALVPHVRGIMEWPDNYAEGRLEVSGVSFSMSKSEIEGAVISGYVRLVQSDGAWAWNTPHMPFEPYGDASQSTLSDDAVEAVRAVREEARKYLGGERAQPGLFDGAQAASAKGEGEVAYV